MNVENPLSAPDPLLAEARELVLSTRNPSVSLIQRVFKLGYGRASALLEAMAPQTVTVPDESGWRWMASGVTVPPEER